MSFQDSLNMFVSSLAILAISIFEKSCGKQTDKQLWKKPYARDCVGVGDNASSWLRWYTKETTMYKSVADLSTVHCYPTSHPASCQSTANIATSVIEYRTPSGTGLRKLDIDAKKSTEPAIEWRSGGPASLQGLRRYGNEPWRQPHNTGVFRSYSVMSCWKLLKK